jgi:hypothetical protein
MAAQPIAAVAAAVTATKTRVAVAVASISSLSLWEVKVATHKPPGLQKPLERGWLLNVTVK